MPPRQRNVRGEGVKLRDDLLIGAQRILERTGSEDAVSLRAVAREVGVSAPSIYAHFADGKAIMDAVVQQTFARLAAALRDARDAAAPPDRLFAVCMAYIRFGIDRPEEYLTLFERRRSLARAQQLDSEERVFADTKGAEAFGILTEALSALTVDAARASEDDIHRHAALLWAALHGYVTLRSSSPHFPWLADDDAVCRSLVQQATTAVNQLR